MVIYITGSSKGIGKALAKALLDANHVVVGLARTSSIVHKNYTHISIDLADIKDVVEFKFAAHDDNVILINNAGIIGEIKPLGKNSADHFIKLNTINVISPQILMNKFMDVYMDCAYKFQILNISSGAGRHPIDAWACYCSSKASMDMFSETINGELKDRGYKNWKVYSVAPGVVDTAMQEDIRNANEGDCLVQKKFIDLKRNSQLMNPNDVAKKLVDIILGNIEVNDVKLDVRSL